MTFRPVLGRRAVGARGRLKLLCDTRFVAGSCLVPDTEMGAVELFALGGFLQLSGYRTGELLGREMAFGRLVYNYRVSTPGRLDGAYVGLSLEAGRIGAAAGSNSQSSAHRGASL